RAVRHGDRRAADPRAVDPRVAIRKGRRVGYRVRGPALRVRGRGRPLELARRAAPAEPPPSGGVRAADRRPDRGDRPGHHAAGEHGDCRARAPRAGRLVPDRRRVAVAPRRVAAVAALALLNASLSFHNIWPTPLIAWTGELSIELAIALLALLSLLAAARA